MWGEVMDDPELGGGIDRFAESGDEVYAVMDDRGALTAWSPGAERLLGYSAQEVRGRRGTDLLETGSDGAGLLARCGNERFGTTGADVVRLGVVGLRHRSGHSVEVALQARRLVSTAGDLQWLVQAEDAGTARRRELGRAL
ncbi:PAS domain S-box protein, partial [Streptomyces sp. NPDC054838]